MEYGTLKDYAERLGLFPSYKAPKYLGKDEEFAYFEFRIPHLMNTDKYHDEEGVLPEGWMLDMIELPVHTGIELVKCDKTFAYYKCKVPLCIMKSWMGMGYFAPQMEISNEMPPPSPDHEKMAEDIFERAKKDTAKKYQQYKVTFRCKCGLEETEIHNDMISGLMWRYCGSCGSTVLQLIECEGLWPEGRL